MDVKTSEAVLLGARTSGVVLRESPKTTPDVLFGQNMTCAPTRKTRGGTIELGATKLALLMLLLE